MWKLKKDLLSSLNFAHVENSTAVLSWLCSMGGMKEGS